MLDASKDLVIFQKKERLVVRHPSDSLGDVFKASRVIFSQSFAKQFVRGGTRLFWGFDFDGYIAARKSSGSGGAIKSPVTFVLDWLASIYKSASNVKVTEEWTSAGPIDGLKAATILDPVISLATDVAEGTSPEKVAEIGGILSKLSDRLNQLDALDKALPADQV